MIIQRDGLRSDAIGQYLVLSLGKLPESSVDTPKETPALRAVGSAGSSPYSAESTVETSPSGPVSLTVLTKSLTVRALEIGPRGPADDARPSLSAPCVLTGPGVPCPQPLLASPGPVSPMLLHGLGIILPSRLTRFLFCSTVSGSPGTTSPRSSLLIPLVSWNSFYASPLRSLRTLSSPHSSGDRPAPRQPRPVTTVVPCLSNNLPTDRRGRVDANEPWKAGTGESSRGHTLWFHGALGSVWVVVVVVAVAVFPKTYAVALIPTASMGKERIVPRISGEGNGNPLQSPRPETPVGGGAR